MCEVNAPFCFIPLTNQRKAKKSPNFIKLNPSAGQVEQMSQAHSGRQHRVFVWFSNLKGRQFTVTKQLQQQTVLKMYLQRLYRANVNFSPLIVSLQVLYITWKNACFYLLNYNYCLHEHSSYIQHKVEIPLSFYHVFVYSQHKDYMAAI